MSAYARELGRSQLHAPAYEDDPDGVLFAEHRGFVVVNRSRMLHLVVDRCPGPSLDLPPGITITTLAEQPELARGVWETTRETVPDIPFDGEAPLSTPPFEEFAAQRLAGPQYVPDATFVALHGSEAVGYGQLEWSDRAAGIALHAMLAVRRPWRGQRVGQALKAAQIAWAIDNGLSELRTGNEERNTAARAVNAHFSYTSIPDALLYRGPLAAD